MSGHSESVRASVKVDTKNGIVMSNPSIGRTARFLMWITDSESTRPDVKIVILMKKKKQ
jgi:hypothetical protein